MNRKTQPNSVLNNLPADHQKQIIQWLENHSYRQVVDRIAAPAPAGFGVKTHITSLRRFYQKHLQASEPPTPVDLLDPDTAAASLDPDQYSSDEDFLEAVRVVQAQNAFLLSLQARTNFKAFMAAARFLIRTDMNEFTRVNQAQTERRIDLKNRRLEFERQVAERKARLRELQATSPNRNVPPKTHSNPTPNTTLHATSEIFPARPVAPDSSTAQSPGVPAPALKAPLILAPAETAHSAGLYFPPPDLFPSSLSALRAASLHSSHSTKNTPQPNAKHNFAHKK